MIPGTCYWFFRENQCSRPSTKIKLCKHGSLCKYLHWTREECQEYLSSKHDDRIQKMECNQCKGTQKMIIYISKQKIQIECHECKGKGFLLISNSEYTKKKLLQKDASRIWCQCHESFSTVYYKDNEHPRCSKHCYVCIHCKGITQIG